MPHSDYLNAYLERVSGAIASINTDELGALANAIMAAVASGGQVLYLGNGGSAATATHYVNDLVMAYARTGRVIRASSLSDNAALVTGISNDYSFDEVFAYQLKATAQAGDLVVAISASGNSPNLVRAIEYAGSAGMTTAAVLGFDGGKLKGIVDVAVHIPTKLGDYGPAEDAHLVVNHAIAGAIRASRD